MKLAAAWLSPGAGHAAAYLIHWRTVEGRISFHRLQALQPGRVQCLGQAWVRWSRGIVHALPAAAAVLPSTSAMVEASIQSAVCCSRSLRLCMQLDLCAGQGRWTLSVTISSRLSHARKCYVAQACACVCMHAVSGVVSTLNIGCVCCELPARMAIFGSFWSTV